MYVIRVDTSNLMYHNIVLVVRRGRQEQRDFEEPTHGCQESLPSY